MACMGICCGDGHGHRVCGVMMGMCMVDMGKGCAWAHCVDGHGVWCDDGHGYGWYGKMCACACVVIVGAATMCTWVCGVVMGMGMVYMG